MAALDALVEVLIYLDRAGGAGAAVRGNGHKVHRAVYIHMTHEIGHENKAALENAHENGVLAVEIARDLTACLGDGRFYLLRGDKNSLYILYHYSFFLSRLFFFDLYPDDPVSDGRGDTPVHREAAHGDDSLFVPYDRGEVALPLGHAGLVEEAFETLRAVSADRAYPVAVSSRRDKHITTYAVGFEEISFEQAVNFFSFFNYFGADEQPGLGDMQRLAGDKLPLLNFNMLVRAEIYPPLLSPEPYPRQVKEGKAAAPRERQRGLNMSLREAFGAEHAEDAPGERRMERRERARTDALAVEIFFDEAACRAVDKIAVLPHKLRRAQRRLCKAGVQLAHNGSHAVSYDVAAVVVEGVGAVLDMGDAV